MRAPLAEVLADEATRWQPLRVEEWHGGGPHDVEAASATAVWRHSGLPVVPIRRVLIRDPKDPSAPPQALLCTDLDRTPEQIVGWFVRRWRVETTFQEVRAHLGVGTQRQWSDRAIARTTPCLLALFSIVTLLAARLPARERRFATGAACYPKTEPTFSDAPAAVRRAIWRERHFRPSRREGDRGITPSDFRPPGPTPFATRPDMDKVEFRGGPESSGRAIVIRSRRMTETSNDTQPEVRSWHPGNGTPVRQHRDPHAGPARAGDLKASESSPC